MKMSDIKQGTRIEDILVPYTKPRYGIILRIDKNNTSSISGEKLPIIIGLPKGKEEYIEWWTSLDYFNKTWRLADNAKKTKQTDGKRTTVKKNKTKAKKS